MDTWPSEQKMQRTIIHMLGFFIDKETEYMKISPENVFSYMDRLYFSIGVYMSYLEWFRKKKCHKRSSSWQKYW